MRWRERAVMSQSPTHPIKEHLAFIEKKYKAVYEWQRCPACDPLVSVQRLVLEGRFISPLFGEIYMVIVQ